MTLTGEIPVLVPPRAPVLPEVGNQCIAPGRRMLRVREAQLSRTVGKEHRLLGRGPLGNTRCYPNIGESQNGLKQRPSKQKRFII